jgi:hypothetical protein
MKDLAIEKMREKADASQDSGEKRREVGGLR